MNETEIILANTFLVGTAISACSCYFTSFSMAILLRMTHNNWRTKLKAQ